MQLLSCMCENQQLGNSDCPQRLNGVFTPHMLCKEKDVAGEKSDPNIVIPRVTAGAYVCRSGICGWAWTMFGKFAHSALSDFCVTRC